MCDLNSTQAEKLKKSISDSFVGEAGKTSEGMLQESVSSLLWR